MKHKNFIRKVLPLLLSAALCLLGVASTVAWVVTNRKLDTKNMALHMNMPRGVFATTDPLTPAEFNSSLWEEYDFKSTVSVSSDRYLNPVSSNDAQNFYMPSDVLSDGTANEDLTGDWYVLLEQNEADDYIIDQTFYLCNTYTSDITLRLDAVNITRTADGTTDTNLYRAVRAAVIVGGTTTIYRVVEGTQNYGAALPITGVKSTATVDPSVAAGTQSSPYVTVTLPHAVQNEAGSTSNMTLYTTSIQILVWIEGQNDYAVASYAGNTFSVSFTFEDATQ